jgi:hypothetical protein
MPQNPLGFSAKWASKGWRQQEKLLQGNLWRSCHEVTYEVPSREFERCSTIDEIVNQLKSTHLADNLSTVEKSRKLSREAGLSRSIFYNEIALRLALGFHSNIFDFEFRDKIVNEIHGVITVHNEDRPNLYWEVFSAFDAGEFAEFLRKHNAHQN